MRRRLLLAAAVAVSTSAHAVDLYVPGSDNDPLLRTSDYLAGDHRYFSAASELLKLQTRKPQQRLPPAFYRRLADYTLSFGMSERSEVIYRELEAANPDPVTLARARIRGAEFEFERGRSAKAISDLKAVRSTVPAEALPDWQDTMSRALMAEGRYSEAVEVLGDLVKSDKGTAYARYNLGVALIKDGRAGQGIGELDRVGRLVPRNEEDLALRDKANLALGYHLLRQQQGGTAINVFSRVRSDGPVSSRALLGLGWAYLAPRGTKQRKVEVGDELPNTAGATKSLSTIGVLLRPGFVDEDIYRRAGLRALNLTKVDREQEASLKRALVPWVELIGRDAMDPAVQEALLAIPFSLDRLGAFAESQQFYEKAIAALEASRKRIDETNMYVRSGRMISTMIRRTADSEAGWTWELKDLPDGQETFYLQGLLAENRFQEQLKNYRDLQFLRGQLDAQASRIAALQAAWLKRDPAKIQTDLLFERELQRGAEAAAAAAAAAASAPPAPPAPVKLVASETLGVHDGAPAANVPPPPVATVPPLQVAPAPPAKQFDGTWERLEALKARVAAAQPKVVAAADAQGKLLEGLAIADLAEQKRMTEKYLTEARFALARIYDRQLKGEAP